MNKNIILVIILSLTLNISVTQAAPAVGSGFTYQGELIDNGSPANGDYEVTLALFTQLTGGTDFGTLTFTPVTITNGLFTIDDVDFGDAVYADNNQFYIEVSVREVGAASFDILTPRQRLQAVPYAVQAEFLAAGGATNGDILQFNGSDWVAAATSGIAPWQFVPGAGNTGKIYYDAGFVGVGTNNPSIQFQVDSQTAAVARFHGTNNSSVYFDESGGVRGYIGSRNTTANDEDFQIGTAFSNFEGDMHLTIRYEPKLTINEDTGRVGVGTTTPTDRLHIRSEAGENALRVQVDGNTKLRVSANGSVAIGTNYLSTPDNGLYVHGDSQQLASSNGMMKYMISANCGTSTFISRSYNGTHVAGSISSSAGIVGRCTFTFPTNVDTRYFQANAVTNSGNSRVGCYYPAANQLSCRRMTASSGTATDGPIMILIY